MKRVVVGWKMPPNTIYVGRPSQWGNPYRPWHYEDRENCLRDYRIWLQKQLAKDPEFLDELKGKDLACWCPLNQSCHADVLLEFLKGAES